MRSVMETQDAIVVGPLQIHPACGLVTAGGRAVPMSVREFGLLVALAEAEGTIVSRDELCERVWGRDLRPGDRSVDVYVHKLRSKLEDALPAWRFIHTHVGFGYRFEPAFSHAFHNQATDP